MKRSKEKGLFFFKKKPGFVYKNLITRASTVLPNFVGSTYPIHSGKTFKSVTVTKDMIGHKFGEFCNTRAKHIFKKKKQKKKQLKKWGKK